jgi:hypothetical protein
VRIPQSAVSLLVLAAALQIFLYYPHLPEIVASHFDGAGNPNGWSSKVEFFLIYVGVVILQIGLFALLPSFLPRLPDAWIRLPGKDYWLAPERRAETLTILRRRLLWFGVANLVFAICTFQMVIHANLSEGQRLSAPLLWLLLGAYATFLLCWIIRLFQKFPKAPGPLSKVAP